MAKPKRQCSIDECERSNCAHGWCSMHYRRWKKHGDPLYVRVSPIERTCSACGETKPIALFRRADLNDCRSCYNQRRTTQRWRTLYPNGKQLALFGVTEWETRQRVIRYNTEWNRAHPWIRREAGKRRDQALGSKHLFGISRVQIAERMRYFGNRCWICDAPQEQVDHVKPLSKGGAHMLCNLRPICKRCNRKKSARWPFSPDLFRSVA